MQKPTTVTVTEYNYDTSETDTLVEDLSLYSLAKSLKPQHVGALLERWLNSYDSAYERGLVVGEVFLDTHRNIQTYLVQFLLGCLVGVAAETITDPRNKAAIETAQEIKSLVQSGSLPVKPLK